jgi:uncharacterized protein
MTSALTQRFGPTALVTGASDGIGRAFAEALAVQGFDLILVARREAVLQDHAADLRRVYGIKVDVMATDLSDPIAVTALIDRTATSQIGLLVASAGFGSLGPFLSQDVASELNMVDLNCRAVVALTHGIGNRMAQAGRGGIILFSSIVGFQGAPNSATYAATKSFVQSFAEGLASELKPKGISVLSVAPGPVATGFAARAGMQMGQAETPEIVARVALRALPGGGTVRPGFLAKLLGWSLGLMPRWGRVLVLGQIMRGMLPKPRG